MTCFKSPEAFDFLMIGVLKNRTREEFHRLPFMEDFQHVIGLNFVNRVTVKAEVVEKFFTGIIAMSLVLFTSLAQVARNLFVLSAETSRCIVALANFSKLRAHNITFVTVHNAAKVLFQIHGTSPRTNTPINIQLILNWSNIDAVNPFSQIYVADDKFHLSIALLKPLQRQGAVGFFADSQPLEIVIKQRDSGMNQRDGEISAVAIIANIVHEFPSVEFKPLLI